MIKKNKLGISHITGKCYVGNVKDGMWTKREELDESDVIDFILNYLIYYKNDVSITGADGKEQFRIVMEDKRNKEEK